MKTAINNRLYCTLSKRLASYSDTNRFTMFDNKSNLRAYIEKYTTNSSNVSLQKMKQVLPFLISLEKTPICMLIIQNILLV